MLDNFYNYVIMYTLISINGILCYEQLFKSKKCF